MAEEWMAGQLDIHYDVEHNIPLCLDLSFE
jgi:hypothetical protein